MKPHSKRYKTGKKKGMLRPVRKERKVDAVQREEPVVVQEVHESHEKLVDKLDATPKVEEKVEFIHKLRNKEQEEIEQSCPVCGCVGDSQESRPWEYSDEIARFRCKQCGVMYQVCLATGEIQM